MSKDRLAKIALEIDKILEVNDYRKAADPFEKLPPGWTQESLKKFWNSMTGDVKHKITKCIKKMSGTGVTDPGAFCGALAKKMGYRSNKLFIPLAEQKPDG